MTDKKIEFPATVTLIDVVYLNQIIADFKKNFEQMLKRELQNIDFANFMTYVALDALVPVGNNEIQVILVHEPDTKKIVYSQPSDLKEELDGMAFQSNLGEFYFATISPEEITSRQDLYLDLFQVLGESEDVKKIIAIPATEEYGTEITVSINEIPDKEIIWFRMDHQDGVKKYQSEILAYPIMQALGIKGDEIK